MNDRNPLIIALDTSSTLRAMNLVAKLKVTGCAFKVGSELFLTGGPKIVEKIVNQDVRVFLDLKFHDIPNTVAQAATLATELGVWMFNVHALGGEAMMVAAREASMAVVEKKGMTPPILLAVTVLTSHSSLQEINIQAAIPEQVRLLAALAKKAGCDGVVASAHEAGLIRADCGEDFVIVTPGIRPEGSAVHDQKRVTTPREALSNGSHYLVMGRPVTESNRPLQVIEEVRTSLRSPL